jgi:hypothetical protein
LNEIYNLHDSYIGIKDNNKAAIHTFYDLQAIQICGHFLLFLSFFCKKQANVIEAEILILKGIVSPDKYFFEEIKKLNQYFLYER